MSNVESLKDLIQLIKISIKFDQELIKKGNTFVQSEVKKDLPYLKKRLKHYQKILMEERKKEKS